MLSMVGLGFKLDLKICLALSFWVVFAPVLKVSVLISLHLIKYYFAAGPHHHNCQNQADNYQHHRQRTGLADIKTLKRLLIHMQCVKTRGVRRPARNISLRQDQGWDKNHEYEFKVQNCPEEYRRRDKRQGNVQKLPDLSNSINFSGVVIVLRYALQSSQIHDHSRTALPHHQNDRS